MVKQKDTVTRKRRRKMHTIEKLSSLMKLEHVRNFIHPAFKRLAIRHDCKRSLFSSQKKSDKKNPSICLMASKIQRKTLKYVPFPRVPPFYCPKCGLSSRKMVKLVKHICSRRQPEYPNVEKIVQLGFRSRIRDSLAVMERIPNPQSIKIPIIDCSFVNNLNDENCHNPPTLASITYKIVSSLHLHYDTIVENDRVYKHQKFDRPIVLNDNESNKFVRSENGNGFYCIACEHLFARFMDYDDHLEGNEKCTKVIDPVEIEVSTNSYYPKSGLCVRKQKSIKELNDEIHEIGEMTCSKCGRHEFSDRSLFYEHIFACALV